MADELKTIKFQMMLSPMEAERIDDWGFGHRIRSRAEAIRRLCQIGIAFDKEGEAIMKRSERALRALLLTAERVDKSARGGIAAAIDEQLQAYKAAVAAYLHAAVISETKYGAEVDELVEAASALTSTLREEEPKK